MFKRQELEELFAQGKMTRRELMARASALGVTAAMSTSLLSNAVQAAPPQRGGRFTLGLPGANTSDSLDPGQLVDAFASEVSFGQCRNCLVELHEDNTPKPELAESWEASKDASIWVFTLRKGVEFHSGKTLDAADVVYTMDYHRSADSTSAAKGLMAPIKHVKADGKQHVVFELKGGNADFPYILSDYHLSIVPAGTTGGAFEKGIGTGGYILKEWEPGIRALSVRNPHYWKAGHAHFDEVETLGINDVNARTTALRTGTVDVISRCEPKTMHLLAKISGITVIQTTGFRHYSIPMRTDTPPFDDNNVRMALKHAIDREVLLNIILRGYGVLGNDTPIGPGNRYYASAAELPQRQYDPDKAKWYLKQAGLHRLKVDLSAADAAFQGAVDAALLYKEHASQAGIDINVIREPNDGYWSGVWMKKSWCMCFWGGRATEDWMFSTTYAADAAWNDTFWNHEQFNHLLVAARAELDEAKRREMYVAMQRIVRDEGGVVIPLFASHLQATRDTVRTPATLISAWELDGGKCSERWWFARS